MLQCIRVVSWSVWRAMHFQPNGNSQVEQAENLWIPVAPVDGNPEIHGRYQPELPGRPAPLSGNPAGGMPEIDLNMIKGTLAQDSWFIKSRYLWLSVYGKLLEDCTPSKCPIGNLKQKTRTGWIYSILDQYESLHFCDWTVVYGAVHAVVWEARVNCYSYAVFVDRLLYCICGFIYTLRPPGYEEPNFLVKIAQNG